MQTAMAYHINGGDPPLACRQARNACIFCFFMAQRSKNLLEAFNTSQKAEKHETGPTATPGRAGGPFAGPVAPAPSAASAATPRVPAPRPLPESRAARVVIPPLPQAFDNFLRTTLPLLFAVGIAGFLLGRASVSRVDAGSDGERAAAPTNPTDRKATLGSESPPVVSKPPQQNEPPKQLPAGDTARIFDKGNRYTILVASYKKTESAKALGEEAYAYLKRKGFEVFPLYAGGSMYQLFVGAAPQQVELDSILTEIRRVPGPSGRAGDFSSALLVPIDQHVAR